ncbi:MAG: cyanophycin synthetase [Gammaproteobacteria bacterium]|nr:cyanophycin synthetase [Gammaproteobacteria bacterium]
MRTLKALVYAWISERYMHGCSNYNTLEVRKGCRSKEQGRTVFEKNDIPHARGKVFFWPWEAVKFVREYGFPVVIKPNVSGYSRGSYFPINSYRELYHALFWVKAWWPVTIVEQYLKGSNYRVLATGDGLISVIQRYPPFVTGNGSDTISVLIDKENQVRKEMRLHPTIFPISKTDQVDRHLAKQNLALGSIPADGERVELFHRVALAPGGVVETIDQSSIPDENKRLFFHVVRLFGANVLGIDVIFEKGIQIPCTEQKCIFIEVNSRPYIKMHYHPRYGEVEDFSDSLAELDNIEIPDQDIF